MNRIDQAIERLRGNWRQGEWGDVSGDGPVCALGAMSAMGIGYGTEETRAVYAEVIAMAVDDRAALGGLVGFNDDPSTTEEDVILLLKKASARFDERAGA